MAEISHSLTQPGLFVARTHRQEVNNDAPPGGKTLTARFVYILLGRFNHFELDFKVDFER